MATSEVRLHNIATKGFVSVTGNAIDSAFDLNPFINSAFALPMPMGFGSDAGLDMVSLQYNMMQLQKNQIAMMNCFSKFFSATGTSNFGASFNGANGVSPFSFLNMTGCIQDVQGGAGVSETSSNDAPRKYSKPSGKGLDKAFLNRVKEVAQNINCDYKDLLAVMNSESGLDSKAYNKNGGATGLIQFMPKIAQMLGTSTAALAQMSPIEQLDYVEKYYLRNKKAYLNPNQRLTAAQLYTLTFLPARSNREVLTTRGEAYYSANSVLDTNGDDKITQSELAAKVRAKSVDESIFA